MKDILNGSIPLHKIQPISLCGASGTGKTCGISWQAKRLKQAMIEKGENPSDFDLCVAPTFVSSYRDGGAVKISEMFNDLDIIIEKITTNKNWVFMDEADKTFLIAKKHQI